MRNRSKATVSFIAILSLCVLASGSHAFAQDTPTPTETSGATASTDRNNQLCTIGGTVSGAGTGEPLKKVTVTLSPETPSKSIRAQTVLSDASGHFSIEHIRPGRYHLSVSRQGYLDQSYGQQSDSFTGAVLSLGAGQKMNDLIFRLQKTAVISGRVLDEDGEPLVRATIEVLRRRKIGGQTKLEPVGMESTDDQGDYRVFDLPPGRYIVRVKPQGRGGNIWVDNNDDGDDDSEGPPSKYEYPETYYPGAGDSAHASALDVNAGDEIPRIDFFLSPREPKKTYRIRGHVTNTLADDSGRNAAVMAIARNSEENRFGQFVTQPDQKTGNFELPKVPPGSYTIMAYAFGGQRIRSAVQDVEIVNADVDSVSLVLTHGVDISGRITFEGQAAASTGQINVMLESRQADMPFGESSSTTAKPDGSFTLKEVGDGTYFVQTYSKCGECYLKSATAGGVDLMAQGLAVTSGSAPTSIELVYSSNTGKAAGTVTNEDDLPAPGAFVILVKDTGPRGESDAPSQTATTDQYGKFEITGVPPGHYKALAWGKADPDSYSDPDFLKPFLARADSVDISAGSTASLSLRAITGKQADEEN
jgi:hypothetical protein